MFEVSKRFSFSAAHILPGHPKCGRMHGHNYEVEVVVASDQILITGMVMDFNALSKVVDPIINEIDHKFILSEDNVANKTSALETLRDEELYKNEFDGKPYLSWSTAEALAEFFFNEITRGFRIQGYPENLLKEVTVWETPKCRATYQP